MNLNNQYVNHSPPKTFAGNKPSQIRLTSLCSSYRAEPYLAITLFVSIN